MNLPAHLANRPSRGLTDVAALGLGGNNPPHVSIKAQRFTLVDGAGNTRPLETLHLDAVIIDVNQNVSKIYYAKKFDPSATEFAPPDCFSDNGVGPSSQAMVPQSGTCAACPNNVWGSEVSQMSGKSTKACNDYKKLAVLLPGDDLTYLLRVPPATLKNFRAYIEGLKTHKAALEMLVTRITFDPAVQGVLNFAPVGWADEATIALSDKLYADGATGTLVGKNDTVWQGKGGAAPMSIVQQQLNPYPAQLQQMPPPPAAPAQDAPKGRGRPRKQEAAAPTQAPFLTAAPPVVSTVPPPVSVPAQPPIDGGLEIPDFLKRAEPAAPAVSGVVINPAPPPADIADKVAAAFSLPLPGR